MSPSFPTLRVQYSSALKRFLASTKNFDVITSIPPLNRHQPPSSSSTNPEVLYVLDSSFNPPTLAHRKIASSALLENPEKRSRLLLLLATQNADKPSKPASFEDRLSMMELFAQDLVTYLQSIWPTTENGQFLPEVDIGVTKKPYFVDKAAEIESAGLYPESLEQIHLTGYDTLIRIFNPKYYPPDYNLRALEPFLSKHRLRVTMRPDGEWGNRDEQHAFILKLSCGEMDNQGAKREWAQRICLVEGKKPDEQPVSSTLAREAAQANPQDLEWLVPQTIGEFVLSERPYSE